MCIKSNLIVEIILLQFWCIEQEKLLDKCPQCLVVTALQIDVVENALIFLDLSRRRNLTLHYMY